jgi:Ca2+-binding EF-hand superfamily protein
VELHQAVEHSAYSFGLSSEEASELLFDVDANGDNYVDFSEFTRLVSGVITEDYLRAGRTGLN